MKRLTVVATILALGIVIFGSQIVAAETARCVIKKINQTTSITKVVLDEVDDVFTNKAFKLAPNTRNQMLAIFLTAYSLDSEVTVLFDDGSPALINTVQLIK